MMELLLLVRCLADPGGHANTAAKMLMTIKFPIYIGRLTHSRSPWRSTELFSRMLNRSFLILFHYIRKYKRNWKEPIDPGVKIKRHNVGSKTTSRSDIECFPFFKEKSQEKVSPEAPYNSPGRREPHF
jgi:hypothetical protein